MCWMPKGMPIIELRPAKAGFLSGAARPDVIVLLLFLQAIGGLVAGIFATEITEGELLVCCGAASFLLEHMGHQKSRGVPDRWWLAELLMAPGYVIPVGTDQVQAQSFDQVLTDFSGGGHGVKEPPTAEANACSWCTGPADAAESPPRPTDR